MEPPLLPRRYGVRIALQSTVHEKDVSRSASSSGSAVVSGSTSTSSCSFSSPSAACKSWDGFWEAAVFLETSALAKKAPPRPQFPLDRIVDPLWAGAQSIGLISKEFGDTSTEEEPDGEPETVRLYSKRPRLLAMPWIAHGKKQPGKYLMAASSNGDPCQPTARWVAGTAVSGLILGARLALYAGMGHAIPTLTGAVSSLLATSGATACVMAVEHESPISRVELNGWTLVGLAAVCGVLAPLPLAPLPRAAMVGVGGPIRLALPGVVGAIVIFEIGHRYWACIDPSTVASLQAEEREVRTTRQGNQDGKLFGRVSKHWAKHFMPTLNMERGIGLAYFAATLAVTYFAVHIDLSMTTWRKTFINVLQARDLPGLYRQLWDFAPVAVASTLAGIYTGYLTTIWDLRWREELTHDFVRMWLDKKSYYYIRFLGQESQAEVDNFDQRIVEDTALFANMSRSLLCSFAEAIVRLGLFGPALIRISPTPLVWQTCLAISFVSSIMTHVVGHPLATRGAALQSAEADFRSALMRLRVFAEDIALQRGEAAEGSRATRHLENVKAATWLVARGTMNLSTFTSAYGLIGGVVPFLVLVPSYFHGDMSIGTMFQIEAVMGGVQQSLGFFVGSYSDIAEWRASAGRLLALEMIVEDEPMQGLRGDDDDSNSTSLGADGLTLTSHSSTTLLEDVSFEWRVGDFVALVGSPGSGKSALLRMLAGAWPPPTAGRVFPGIHGVGVLLVPSAGFLLPSRTALRKCLAYPEADPPPDEELEQAMITCGLEALLDDLDVEADWATVLSLGDRQRLVFARLMARWPAGVRWLLLDDVDTALSQQTALTLHDQLVARLPDTVGIVVTSCHAEVVQRSGWRRFRLDVVGKQLLEENAPACTGEAPGGLNLAPSE